MGLKHLLKKYGCPKWTAILSFLFLTNAGRFADSVAQIIEFSSSDFTAPNLFDVIDFGRMQRQCSLYANAIRNAANRDGLFDSAALSGDQISFKQLKSFSCAFFYFQVYPDQVTDFQFRQIRAKLRLLNKLY